MHRSLVGLLLLTAVTLCACSAPPTAPARDVTTGFLARTIEVDGTARRYVLFVPPDYAPDHSWPLLVFLNGAGECGTDGWKQVAVGLGQAIQKDVRRWPFLVLFPQKPDRGSAWEDHAAMIDAMLARTRGDFAIDERRLFLTGLSQGGHGTWALGARQNGGGAHKWAALAPVCGYGDAAAIGPGLAGTPIWCFHGEDDKAVACQQSKDLVAAVRAAGGDAKLTLYPGTGHNSWDKAYGEAGLAEWFLAIGGAR